MRMSQAGPASILLVLALLTVAVPRASAIPVIRTWEGLPGSIPPTGCTPGPGSGSGTWFSLGWGCDGGSYATPPNNAAGVEFEARIDAKAGAGSVVTLDTAVTLDKLFIGLDFDDELIMANGARLTIVQRNDGSSGSIENLGRLTMGATNFDTDLQISGGTVTLDGSGVVDLSDDTQNRIYGLAPGDGLVNENNVIQGAGQIGVNLLTLENQGIILATGSATLTVDPDAGGMINGGVLRAFGGGTLVLRAPTYANDGGEIDARDLSIVQLNGARVEGGTLRSSGSGVIRVLGSATLDPANPIVNLGLLELPDATILNLQPGTIVNSGTLALESAANTTDLVVEGGDVILQGVGEIRLSASQQNRIYGTGTARLVNESNRISGAGQLGVNLMGIVNRGEIEANQSGLALVVDPDAVSGAVSPGTMRAVSGGILELRGGSFQNFEGGDPGLVRVDASELEVDGATVTGGQVEVLGAGLVRLRAGEIASDFSNSATGVVRAESGTSTFDGSVDNPGGGRILVENAARLRLRAAGSYLSAGSIELASTGSSTDLLMNGGDVLLTGGGELILSDQAQNRIYGEAVGDRLVNVDHTIRGAGQIGVNLMGLVNQAIIEADGTAFLTVDPNGSNVVNTGTLRAVSGATLRLRGGTYTNTGGLVEAQDASLVDLSSVTLVGGDLSTAGTGELRVTGTTTLDGVSNGGLFSVENGDSATLVGPFVNSGTVLLDSAGGTTNLILSGAVTLSGGGQLQTSSQANNRIFGSAAADVLTNQDNQIVGSGQIGVNQMGLLNRSLIEADDPSADLVIDPSAAGGAINAGVMRASAGATLELRGGVFQNFEGATPGLVEADASTLEVASASVDGGHVQLLGASLLRLAGGTVTAASLSIGSSAVTRAISGTSSLGGGVSNAPGGEIVVEDGADLVLLSSGTFTNRGTLRLEAVSGGPDLFVSGGTVQLGGGGQLVMNDAANNRIGGLASTDRLHNLDNTISGAGNLGNNGMGFTNDGIVEASGTVPLRIDPNALGAVNNGTLRATSGATLEIRGGSFDNGSGLVEAQDQSLVLLQTATVSGGTLRATGSGLFQASGSNTLAGAPAIVLEAPLVLPDAAQTTVSGTLDNRGEIRLESTGSLTNLLLGTDLLLSGGGTITLGDQANNRITGAAGGLTLTNQDNRIQGSGQLGSGIVSLLNQAGGTIVANQATPLELNGPFAGSITNEGTMRAENGATLSFLDPASGSGRLEAHGGEIELRTGVVVQAGLTSVADGGTLTLDSATLRASHVDLATSANLTVDGVLEDRGSFLFRGSDEAQWSWAAGASLEMTGGVGAAPGAFGSWAKLEVGGSDLGTDPVSHTGDPAGFVANFSLEELVIGADARVILTDTFSNGNRGGPFAPREALYVDTVRFVDGAGRLNTGGLNLYYDTLIGNASQVENDPPPDSDDDGLDDVEEELLGTDPGLADSDGDGFDDGVEVAAGSDPLDRNSTPVAVPVSGVLGIAILGLSLLWTGRGAVRRAR